jgi:hypothetical protein
MIIARVFDDEVDGMLKDFVGKQKSSNQGGLTVSAEGIEYHPPCGDT